jgi:hypothetical protein
MTETVLQKKTIAVRQWTQKTFFRIFLFCQISTIDKSAYLCYHKTYHKTTEIADHKQEVTHMIPYKHSSGLAIASLVLGTLATALCCIPILPTICSILGLLFVIRVKKKEPHQKNGIVTAALVLNLCGLGLSLLCLLYWVWYAGVFLHMLERPQEHKEMPPMPKYQGQPARLFF